MPLQPAHYPSIEIWENAYLSFESREEELNKFQLRFKKAGVDKWPKDIHIGDLFCGRGNGLNALELLGFNHLTGIDYSPNLLLQYSGKAATLQADCRAIPLTDATFDAVTIQGGLHHLVLIPEDLEKTLIEISRLLKPNGLFFITEPWKTPFLNFIHLLCGISFFGVIYPKLSYLKTMIEHEYPTYFNWLNHPKEIDYLFKKYFTVEFEEIAFGKRISVFKNNK